MDDDPARQDATPASGDRSSGRRRRRRSSSTHQPHGDEHASHRLAGLGGWLAGFGHRRRWMLLFTLVGANLLLTLLTLSALSPDDAAERQLTLYQRAIIDAERPSLDRVSDQLFPLSADNLKLQWDRRYGDRWVKVVSWQSDAAVTQGFSPDHPNTLVPADGRILRVTLAPQVQEFCRTLPRDEDPSFRLKQYLGLNPSHRYERFVELWVRPAQLFRPCPDPDPSDRRCELEMDPSNTPLVSGIRDYRLWMAELRRQSYQPNGAPWTRLGYTYDWGLGRWGVGASEYILTPDAEFLVDGSYSTDAYCGY